MNDDIKPNLAALARQYDADYRTIKRYLEEVEDGKVPKKVKRPSLLDPYRPVIKERVSQNYSAMSIFKFIQKQGFQGQYTIVRELCSTIKK